jgi:hypothetical protein
MKTFFKYIDWQAIAIGVLVCILASVLFTIHLGLISAFCIVQGRLLTHFRDRQKLDVAFGKGHKPFLFLQVNESIWVIVLALGIALWLLESPVFS